MDRGLPGRHVVSMRWDDTVFIHWPVGPDTLTDRLPDGMDPATFDGRAWLGVVAFEMQNIRPRGLPRGFTFGEVNLRTYVEQDGERGIYFFNLDASDALSVYLARTLFHLPYYTADIDVERRGEEVAVTSHRRHRGVPDAHFDAVYAPADDERRADPDTLEHFLVENYYFVTAANGRRYRGDVAHPPWPLFDAELTLRSTNFLAVNGFERPDVDPVVHYSPGVDVRATPVRRVD